MEGAEGIQMGARFVCSAESPVHVDRMKTAQEIVEETVAAFFKIAGRMGGMGAGPVFG